MIEIYIIAVVMSRISRKIPGLVDTLSQYETGKRQPSKRVLAQVRRVLIERGLDNEPCSPAECDLLRMFRQISPANQEQITGIIRSLAEVSGTR